MNKVFAHGIELTKEAVLLELIASGADNGLLDGVEKWSSPPFLVDADLLRESLCFLCQITQGSGETSRLCIYINCMFLTNDRRYACNVPGAKYNLHGDIDHTSLL